MFDFILILDTFCIMKKLFILAALVAVFLSSCKEDDNFIPKGEEFTADLNFYKGFSNDGEMTGGGTSSITNDDIIGLEIKDITSEANPVIVYSRLFNANGAINNVTLKHNHKYTVKATAMKLADLTAESGDAYGAPFNSPEGTANQLQKDENNSDIIQKFKDLTYTGGKYLKGDRWYFESQFTADYKTKENINISLLRVAFEVIAKIDNLHDAQKVAFGVMEAVSNNQCFVMDNMRENSRTIDGNLYYSVIVSFPDIIKAYNCRKAVNEADKIYGSYNFMFYINDDNADPEKRLSVKNQTVKPNYIYKTEFDGAVDHGNLIDITLEEWDGTTPFNVEEEEVLS